MFSNLLSRHHETRSQKLRRQANEYASHGIHTLHDLVDYVTSSVSHGARQTAQGATSGTKYATGGLASLAGLLGTGAGTGLKYGTKYTARGAKKAAKGGAAVYAAGKLAPRSAKTTAKAGLGVGGTLLVGAVAVAGAAVITRMVVRGRRAIDLEGKVIVVTGASRGLGLEICRILAEYGAKLAICARDEAELREAEEELVRRGASVVARVCDVTNRQQVRSFVEQIEMTHGPIDGLINNAGEIVVGPIETMRIEDYRRLMDIHFYGPLNFMYEVTPGMQRRKSGRVVNIASIGGKLPAPHMAGYIASKHALVGLSEACRSEFAKDNVLVTTVCPGLIRTGSTQNIQFKGDAAEAEYKQYATMGNLPGLSIDSRRMAEKVVDAMIHGDAELITPLPASLQALLHGIAPGISTELASLAGRFAPRSESFGGAYVSHSGHELDDRVDKPERIERIEHRQAERNREI